MTFRQAEHEIRLNHENADEIVKCLKEMARKCDKRIDGRYEVKSIAIKYYDELTDMKRKVPMVLFTDKELRQINALKSINTSLNQIAIRFNVSKTVIKRVINIK